MFLLLITAIVPIIVVIIVVIIDIMFMVCSPFCFPWKIVIIPFNILPPSSGYIGTKFIIANSKFAYIKFIFAIMFIFVVADIIISNIFVAGPAIAIRIFFISSLFAFFILSSNQ